MMELVSDANVKIRAPTTIVQLTASARLMFKIKLANKFSFQSAANLRKLDNAQD
jgi:hypothetical protein